MVNSAVAKTQSESNIRIIQPSAVSVMEQVILKNNLAELAPEDRVRFYLEVCQSIGVNPLTQPFGYIQLDSGLTLYAKKDCTDQLRKIHNVTIEIISRELVDNVYVVTARATLPNGRTDESIGAVPLVKEDGSWETSQNGKRYFKGNQKYLPLSPDARANAMMKGETKAKRRVTLSSIGLGILDESELETIATARIVDVDHTTGRILSSTPVQAIEAGSSSTTGSTSDGGSEIANWTVFWTRAKTKNIDLNTYISVVGRPAMSFDNAQQAWDALIAAENAMGTGAPPPLAEPADPATDTIEANYVDVVDAETGEIVGQEPVAEEPAPAKSAKKPLVFGETPAPADRHTS